MKRRAHLVLRLALALSSLASARAARAEGGRGGAVEKPRMTVIEEDGTGQAPRCGRLVAAFVAHVRARQRFVMTGRDLSLSRHEVVFRCDGEDVRASWTYWRVVPRRGAAGDEVVEIPVTTWTARREGPLADNHEAVALLALEDMLRALPWDGELHATRPLPPRGSGQDLDPEPYLKKPAKGYRRLRADVSVGYVESDKTAACVPVDVGWLDLEGGTIQFRKVGEGLLTDVDPFATRAEIYLKSDGRPAPDLLYRVQPLEGNDDMKPAVKRCRKRKGTVLSTTLTKLGDFNLRGLLSIQTIELNGIQQYVGASLQRLRTTNGLAPGTLVTTYGSNEVEIGDLFLGDARLTRTAFGKPWKEGDQYEAVMTQAEIYAGVRLDYGDYRLAMGPGVFMNKIGIPYDYTQPPPDESGNQPAPTPTGIRPVRLGFAGMAAAMGDWGYFTGNVRLSASFADAVPFVQLVGTLNLKLSDAWLAGGEVAYLDMRRNAYGEPGVKAPSIGAHVGFTLQRSQGRP